MIIPKQGKKRSRGNSGSKFNLVKGNYPDNLKINQNINDKNLTNKIYFTKSSNFNRYKLDSLNFNKYQNSKIKKKKSNLLINNTKSTIQNISYKQNMTNSKKLNKSKNNVSYTNNNFNINFNNVFFCSQRIPYISETINYNSINNLNNNNLHYNNKTNKVNNNVYFKEFNGIYNISRNKNAINRQTITQNKSGNKKSIKSKDKNHYLCNSNINFSYNIPLNNKQKKYIINVKESNIQKNNLYQKRNEQNNNNNTNNTKLIYKENIHNLKNNFNNNYTITIRGSSLNTIDKNKNRYYLTSKNNSKAKVKKKISSKIKK